LGGSRRAGVLLDRAYGCCRISSREVGISLGKVAGPLASPRGLRRLNLRSTPENVFSEITKLSDRLLSDEDDMVRKGLGWLLRETAKAAPARTTHYLMRIRTRTPRLVLRTACETLPPAMRKRILA
jgi:hypothetical protein